MPYYGENMTHNDIAAMYRIALASIFGTDWQEKINSDFWGDRVYKFAANHDGYPLKLLEDCLYQEIDLIRRTAGLD